MFLRRVPTLKASIVTVSLGLVGGLSGCAAADGDDPTFTVSETDRNTSDPEKDTYVPAAADENLPKGDWARNAPTAAKK